MQAAAVVARPLAARRRAEPGVLTPNNNRREKSQERWSCYHYDNKSQQLTPLRHCASVHYSGCPPGRRACSPRRRAFLEVRRWLVSRWKAEKHDPEEVERRNVELDRLRSSEERLFSVVARAHRYGLAEDQLIRAAHRLSKRVPETRRRGPDAIQNLREHLDRHLEKVLAALPPVPLREETEKRPWVQDGLEEGLRLKPSQVVRPRPTLSLERARLQARILGPVLTGTKSAAQATEEWREEFRRVQQGELSGPLSEFAEELRREYANLHVRTVSFPRRLPPPSSRFGT